MKDQGVDIQLNTFQKFIKEVLEDAVNTRLNVLTISPPELTQTLTTEQLVGELNTTRVLVRELKEGDTSLYSTILEKVSSEFVMS